MTEERINDIYGILDNAVKELSSFENELLDKEMNYNNYERYEKIYDLVDDLRYCQITINRLIKSLKDKEHTIINN